MLSEALDGGRGDAMSVRPASIEHIFEGDMMARGETVVLHEYDGGRAVEFQQVGDFVVMETGRHAFAFDAALFRHAMKRALGVTLMIEAEGTALP
jgi:hypothetical protein